MEKFINLNRIFNQLTTDYTNGSKDDDIDLTEFNRFRAGSSLDWKELTNEYRVVILAEAGAGKTQEIRHAALTLRTKNKFAFFMRLEHLADDLESAFEMGTYQEFQNWLNLNEEGWLLLDSVDEARLKDPKDFIRAIRKLSSRISVAIQRTHIVITSRISAWRPITDLSFCETQFPAIYTASRDDETEISEENISLREASSSSSQNVSNDAIKRKKDGFKVYSLADLTANQITTFVTTKGLKNSAEFLRELGRQDAWAFTTRPQDLEELLAFWNDKQRIGTKFELMEHSVHRRLEERDQERRDSKPFTVEKAQKGARLLASASVLMHESAIQIPDGTSNLKGIDMKSVLTDWDDAECQILLSRPIFDEAIYGTVRFHHRSVREYLTAEWFSEQLKNEGARQKIEHLFIRTQYEQEVVIPSMRPILSWLVLFDQQLLLKVYNLEPELILEGGDPGRIPVNLRRKILASVCQKLASNSSYRSFEQLVAVRRFALPDLVSDIINLLEKYEHNSNVTTYLLDLVWQGQMKTALPTALGFALDNKAERHTRIAAIKIVYEVGSKDNLSAVCTHLLTDDAPHDRRIVAELVNSLEASQESATWLLKALVKTQDEELYNTDPLGYSILNFVKRADLDVVSTIVEGIDTLLHCQPFIERRYCEISEQYGWLMHISLKAIEKLIANKHPTVFTSASLFALTQAPTFSSHESFRSWSPSHNIPVLLSEWQELNHALFWKDVQERRNYYYKHEKESLTYFWQVAVFKEFWRFSSSDFQLVADDISSRPLLADRLVALTLAFKLYKENESPTEWFNELTKAVENESELKKRLDELMNPPFASEEYKKWKKRDAQWKRQEKVQEKKRQQAHAHNIKWLNENCEKLRANGLKEGAVSKGQYYLHERMQSINRANTTESDSRNWQGLIKDYGKEVATAFHDGLLTFWRSYTPFLRSESSKNDANTVGIEFGLSGLELESTETTDWPQNLSSEDAERACRYAFHTFGGFPSWFPRLYKRFSSLIHQFIIQEIGWELAIKNVLEAEDYNYILNKVSWDCEWLWDSIARPLLEWLEKEPTNIVNLQYMLKIVQGSTIILDMELARLAERKCKTITSLQHLPYWYATWTSVEPESAVGFFSDRLAELHTQNKEEATMLAMQTIVTLLGGRRSGASVRENFKSPTHLKNLYQLMHQYIRIEEDIDRANKGVYSPGLRDDAQDARDSLFSMLKMIPGKESYLAMMELAKMHPAEGYRSWMNQNAKERAELDADSSPWTVKQFCEFAKTLDCTPANHRELFDIGVQRLSDLKHNLEESDSSIASTLALEKEEVGIRRVIADWCRRYSVGKYLITQEEELADAKRPDCRFHSSLFDAPVPVELKLADNWSGPDFFERLENQLCGDYLRDNQSNRGIFVLVYRGQKTSWQLPNSRTDATFSELVNALQEHWEKLSASYPKIEQITVIGIDLTKRMNRVKPSKKKLGINKQ